MATQDRAGAKDSLEPDDEAGWARVAKNWSFTPGITYLNHGSFGAAPRSVLDARRELLARFNRDPVDFFLRFLQPELAAIRARLGRFLNTDGDNLALVDNATVAMNAIARSVHLAPGDEVLATDREYGAVLRIWQRTCEQAGARLVIAELPSPLGDPAECVAKVFAQASSRTRLLVFSHVTSATAVILPALALCRTARERGIPTCIDGPHSLVTIPVDLAELDCDYYTASCHKWLLSPVGSGLLYVHPRAQGVIQPAVISWGVTLGQPSSWRDEFNWTGTRDPTPILCIPTALDFLETIGIEAFRRRMHYLAKLAHESLSTLPEVVPVAPCEPNWIAAMVALRLPAGEAQPLQDALWEQHRIEVPVFGWQSERLIRVSCQMYTSPADIERLRAAFAELLDVDSR